MPKYVKNCQILNKPNNTFQKLVKIYQSGEILPNLVPLTMILFEFVSSCTTAT